jgi:hypothetical protein
LISKFDKFSFCNSTCQIFNKQILLDHIYKESDFGRAFRVAYTIWKKSGQVGHHCNFDLAEICNSDNWPNWTTHFGIILFMCTWRDQMF